MMRQTPKLIFLELVLLFASILVFRSVWLFLDSMRWAGTAWGLIGLLILGIGATLIALRAMNR